MGQSASAEPQRTKALRVLGGKAAKEPIAFGGKLLVGHTAIRIWARRSAQKYLRMSPRWWNSGCQTDYPGPVAEVVGIGLA